MPNSYDLERFRSAVRAAESKSREYGPAELRTLYEGASKSDDFWAQHVVRLIEQLQRTKAEVTHLNWQLNPESMGR